MWTNRKTSLMYDKNANDRGTITSVPIMFIK
jgi:hypothetical protein